MKDVDRIDGNFIIANYNSLGALDNDDGRCVVCCARAPGQCTALFSSADALRRCIMTAAPTTRQAATCSFSVEMD